MCCCLLALGWLCLGGGALGAETDLAEARRLYQAGDYAKCVTLAARGLAKGKETEGWRLLLTRALLTTGRYPEALATITNALVKEPRSVQLRWLAREVLQQNGQPEAAERMPEEINKLVVARPNAYQEPLDFIAFGQAALLAGVDPKRVLDRAFEMAKRAAPTLSEVYLASGRLALDEHDYALAAKTFQEGLKQQPDDPDLHCGLAMAYEPGDQQLMLASIEAALEHNSNHIGSLLLLASHCIDAEDYAQAGTFLDRVRVVNPFDPDAWAYRAVLGYLQNQPEAAEAARTNALRFWPANPRVDHLIGRKLSQNYRFTEGAAHQREALRFNEAYLPAQAQLAQDLLRLGEEQEGWDLAKQVHQIDGYDVAAFNLVTLRGTMAKFSTLTNEAFVLRMGAQEAAVYGSRVLEFLGMARTNLCAKYGFEVKRPCTVEMFPDQKDFAVRTFGMPDNPGFLGVCFGNVVTANSPASHPGRPVNWQAVLWHEFCHVVTLQLTRNRMPRWLSEGISVYEERQANLAWGQHMTPPYREMILGGKLTPVSKLSGAFLSPKSDLHLQFAYYESSLAVEFLVERFGFDRLKGILRDLGEGMPINQAIEKNTAGLGVIEKDFDAFARGLAEQMAPGANWEKPPQEALTSSMDNPNSVAWTISHPTNFWVIARKAQGFVEAKQWQEARPLLERLVELYPGATGPDSSYRTLAAAQRALGDTNAERQVLSRFAAIDKEAPDAYLRLMELAAPAGDWASVMRNVGRYLAVNPLVAPPYRFLAQAAEAEGRLPAAIEASGVLLRLDPPNPAEVHFTLARLLHKVGDTSARRHALQALEEVPRNRAALRLLLEISGEVPGRNDPSAAPASDANR